VAAAREEPIERVAQRARNDAEGPEHRPREAKARCDLKHRVRALEHATVGDHDD